MQMCTLGLAISGRRYSDEVVIGVVEPLVEADATIAGSVHLAEVFLVLSQALLEQNDKGVVVLFALDESSSNVKLRRNIRERCLG